MEQKIPAPLGHPGLKTTLTGIIVSAILMLVKGAGGYWGHSYALIADAIESSADIFSSTMLWLGLKWASKPADKEHPYGHGKAEALVATGIALGMAAAAAIIAINSIENIRTPHESPAAFTLAILLIVIVTKEVLYRFILKKGIEIESGAVKADASHHRSDAITSAAAFVGIAIGLIGGKGFEVADDWAALIAAAVIFWNAWRIMRPAIGELLDENLDPAQNERIRKITLATPGVANVEKVHTRKMGTWYHADLHVRVDENLNIRQGHDIAHQVKARIQKRLPAYIDIMIHLEPTTVFK